MARKAIVIDESKSREINTGYTPRTIQAELHNNLKRFSVIIAHRRLGKSVFSINHMIDRALRCKLKNPRYSYIAPTFGQAKRVVWQYLKDFTKDIPGVNYNEAELRVDFPHNGAQIMLLSAENPAALRGIYLDGCLLDEFGDMSPTVWTEVVRPTLSDRKGWAIFIGTVKGMNHLWEMYEYAKDEGDPEWYAALFKASETKLIAEEELESARRVMSEEEYLSEYECDPRAGLIGAYFSKELAKAEKENRITKVPYDRALPVDTYWDLGIGDMMAVWFVQSVRGTHHMIDYYEVSGDSIPDVMATLQKKPYTYGRFVLPHDAQVRDLSTGRARSQMFRDLGARRLTIVPRVGSKNESINAARVIFSKCYFDAEKCKLGIKHLGNYQKKWDAKQGVFQANPLHNTASNCADSFQCFAMGNRPDSRDTAFLSAYGDIYEEARSGRDELVADMDYSPFSA